MLKALLLLIFSLSAAHAAETDKTAATIKSTLQKNYSQFIGTVEEVNKSPIPGLYEVIIGYSVFYTDKEGRYLIDGSLIDLKARQNLTEIRAHQLLSLDKLPLELAVKKVKGNGSRKMAYFTDPNCGYCKKLEHELQDVTDVTLYLFLTDVIGGHNSDEKNQSIWCSADKVKAWDDLMLKGVQPVAKKCDTPISQVRQLGAKLKINGTPALIFANGTINPGYMPAADLDRALNINNK